MYPCHEDECNNVHAKKLILQDEGGRIATYLQNLPRNTLLTAIMDEVKNIQVFLHGVQWVFDDVHRRLSESIHNGVLVVGGFILLVIVLPKLLNSVCNVSYTCKRR